MDIEIENVAALTRFSKETGVSPISIVNQFVASLEVLPPEFKIECKETSIGAALVTIVERSILSKRIMDLIAGVLGKHLYSGIKDFEINLDQRSFWFYLGIDKKETRIDFDAIQLWIESDGAQLTVERTILINERHDLEKLQARMNNLLFEDAMVDELEWHIELSPLEGHDPKGLRNTIMMMSIRSEEFSTLLPLVRMDDFLNRCQKNHLLE